MEDGSWKLEAGKPIASFPSFHYPVSNFWEGGSGKEGGGKFVGVKRLATLRGLAHAHLADRKLRGLRGIFPPA